jgi:uncharacterized protein YbjT (DUF2867 family)
LKILVLGAGGFIGGHVAAALRDAGHEVVAGKVDFRAALRPDDWRLALRGIHAVVNAVGIIRERGARRFETLHHAAPRALFDACAAADVRRVVQISALGADEAARSRFHRTKRAADEHLAALELDWTVVQPSLVFGAEGKSARLFALLAALPLTPLPGAGAQQVQPIHVEDLADLVVQLVKRPTKGRVEAVGSRAVTVREWLGILRAQMDLGAPRFVEVPRWAIPVERETLDMLERGNTGSFALISEILGRAPRAPEQFVDRAEGRLLATRAKLEWLAPVLRGSIGVLWIVSGVVSLGLYPLEDSLALLRRVGLESRLVLYGSALLDIALGIATFAWNGKGLWRAQIGLVLAYTAIISVFLPELWLHPFGPVLKNLPILAALALLHELAERR